MSNTDIAYGLVIPGMGDPEWGLTGTPGFAINDPVCLYIGDEQKFSALNVTLVPGLIKLRQLGVKINPFTSVIDSGAQGATIQAAEAVYPVDLAGNEFGTVSIDVAGEFARRPIEANGVIEDALLSPATTTINLWSRTGSEFAAGEMVWIEHEAIYLNSLTGTTGNVQTFTCTRGCLETPARYHTSKPRTGLPSEPTNGWDNRVYKYYRFWGQPCYIVEWVAGTMRVVWRGWFTKDPQLGDGANTLDLSMQDIMAPLFSRKLNVDPHGAEYNGEFYAFNQVEWTGPNTELEANEVTRRFGTVSSQQGSRVVLQWDEAAVSARYDSTTNRYSLEKHPSTSDDTSTLMFDTISPDAWNQEESQKKSRKKEFLPELIVGGYLAENIDGYNYSSILVRPVNGVNLDHHPLMHLLTFLVSSGRGDNNALGDYYDQLSRKLSFGVPHELVDVAKFEQLAEATSEQRMRAYALGWGGKSYDWSDIRAKTLVPFFRYLHPNATGQLSVSDLSVISTNDIVDEISADEIVIFSEEQMFGWDEVLQTIEGNGQLPWQSEARKVVTRDLGQGVNTFDPEPKDVQEKFDLSMFRGLNRVGEGEQRDVLSQLLAWRRRPVPVIRMEVVNPNQPLYAGQKIRLDGAAEYRTQDGTKWEADGYRVGSFRILDGQELANFDTMSMGGVTYRFVTTINNNARNQILIPAPGWSAPDWDTVSARIFHAVNGTEGDGVLAGTHYSTPTTAHPYVEATGWLTIGTPADFAIIFMRSRVKGEITINTADTSTGGTWTANLFTGQFLDRPIKGIVTQVNHDFDSPSYELEVWAINDPLVREPKEIAPSWVVKTGVFDASVFEIVVDTNQGGVDTTEYIAGLSTVYIYRPGQALPLDMYNTGSAYEAEVVNVIDIGSGEYQIDIRPPNATQQPIAGDIVRLSPHTTDAGKAYWFEWIYIANDDDTFSNGAPGDIYV